MAGEKHYLFGKKRPGVGGVPKGTPAWNKGKQCPHSEEWKRKVSLALTGRVGGMTGKHQTKEWCEKHSKFMKSQSAEFFKGCLRKRGMSSLEKRVNDLIVKNSLPYKFVGDGKFMIEKKCPDFINTNGQKIAVEVFYRRHKEEFKNMTFNEWQEQRNKLFARYGWKIIYIDGTRIANETIIDVLERGW